MDVDRSPLSRLVLPASLIVADRTSRSADVVAIIADPEALEVLEPTRHPVLATLALSVRDAAGRTVDVSRESVEQLLDGSVSHAVMVARLRGPRTASRPAA